jgi:hemerythrin-like domain-containing protein
MNEIEKSTKLLREEHQLIENAMVVIADIIKKLENGNTLDRRQVWEMAQAFATFVGRSHHSKEDFLLSMIRARRGCSDEYAVRTFYVEHHRVEVLLASLRKTADEYLETVDSNPQPLVGSLRDVVDFYPGHMWKADHILFPLADELFSETDQGVLVEQFAWIQSAVGGDADEQLRAIAAEFHPKPKAA